jgi:hypothetical protein
MLLKYSSVEVENDKTVTVTQTHACRSVMIIGKAYRHANSWLQCVAGRRPEDVAPQAFLSEG